MRQSIDLLSYKIIVSVAVVLHHLHYNIQMIQQTKSPYSTSNIVILLLWELDP